MRGREGKIFWFFGEVGTVQEIVWPKTRVGRAVPCPPHRRDVAGWLFRCVSEGHPCTRRRRDSPPYPPYEAVQFLKPLQWHFPLGGAKLWMDWLKVDQIFPFREGGGAAMNGNPMEGKSSVPEAATGGVLRMAVAASAGSCLRQAWRAFCGGTLWKLPSTASRSTPPCEYRKEFLFGRVAFLC